MRFITFLKLLVAACVAFAIALVAVVRTIDVQQYRLLVTDLLHAATGRSVAVRGEFQLELSLTPRIVATDIALANLPGSPKRELLKIARVEAEIGLLALLRREVEVLRLTLVNPELSLEVDESGRGNWHLAPGNGGRVHPSSGLPATSFRVNAVTVSGGRLVLQDRSARSVLVLSLSQVSVTAADAATPIAFTAKGELGGLPLDVSGTVGSFTELEIRGKPFPLKLQAAAGSNQAVVEGSIGRLADLAELDLKISLAGTDLAEAARLMGGSAPALGPYKAALRLTGSWSAPALPEMEAAVGKKDLVRLTAKGAIADLARLHHVQLAVSAEIERPDQLAKLAGVDLPLRAPLRAAGRLTDEADGWRLAEVKAVVGRSDLGGEISYGTAEPQPRITAALASKLVDLADFGFKALPPPPRPAGEPLFRDDALLPLTGVTAVDLDVAWHAEALSMQGAPLFTRPGDAMLLLRGGVLMLRPFTAAAAEPSPTVP